jgi:alkanesulfonate monooxygenase SsuD/methylene tetrahydromethanopterin reductase-like flavin-dependent oxidoreductase (luciferase family)
MAAIAGRFGDGFNTQAMHPDLAELGRVAREAHAASGRDPARFGLSVFAGLGPRWLRADAPERVRLERVGVDRLILLASPPYDLGVVRARR